MSVGKLLLILVLLCGLLVPCITASAAEYDVDLLAGQSNMDGRGQAGELTPEQSQPFGDAIIFYRNLPHSSDGWQPLAPGFSVPPREIATNELRQRGDTYTLRGLLWHQGESDSKASIDVYRERLETFIARIRQDTGVADLPVVVGEVLSRDPYEQTDLYATLPQEVERLSEKLRELAASCQHSRDGADYRY